MHQKIIIGETDTFAVLVNTATGNKEMHMRMVNKRTCPGLPAGVENFVVNKTGQIAKKEVFGFGIKLEG